MAEKYKLGTEKTGNSCHLFHLSDIGFNPFLNYGYTIKMELEPDLAESQKLITQANHLEFIYPTGWGADPALLKGFIDRLFLPGYGFTYQTRSPLPIPLMKGKTA